MNRENFIKVLTENLHGNYVEIGTDRGAFANFLLASTNCKKLYCIDPYKQYKKYRDGINNVTGDDLFNYVKNMLAFFGERIQMIRMFSDQAVSLVPNDLDFVYIDGNHSYTYVISDLRNWYPKVRSGGVIVGDDVVDLDDSQRNQDGDVYIKWSEGCDGYYGVYKAVRDFCSEMGISFQLHNNQFVIQK